MIQMQLADAVGTLQSRALQEAGFLARNTGERDDAFHAIMAANFNVHAGVGMISDAVVGPLLGQETIVGRAKRLSGQAGAGAFRLRRGFNAVDEVIGTRYEPFFERFEDALSPGEADFIKVQIDFEYKAFQMMTENGIKGYIAGFLGAIWSPETLIPIGRMAAIYKSAQLVRAARLSKAVANTGKLAKLSRAAHQAAAFAKHKGVAGLEIGLVSGMTEAGLQAMRVPLDPSQTKEEAIDQIVAAGLYGTILGAGFSVAGTARRAFRDKMLVAYFGRGQKDLARRIAQRMGTEELVGKEWEEVRAAIIDEFTNYENFAALAKQDPGILKLAWKWLMQITPRSQVHNSRLGTARALGEIIADPNTIVIREGKVAPAVQHIEPRVEARKARAAEVIINGHNFWARYRKQGGTMWADPGNLDRAEVVVNGMTFGLNRLMHLRPHLGIGARGFRQDLGRTLRNGDRAPEGFPKDAREALEGAARGHRELYNEVGELVLETGLMSDLGLSGTAPSYFPRVPDPVTLLRPGSRAQFVNEITDELQKTLSDGTSGLSFDKANQQANRLYDLWTSGNANGVLLTDVIAEGGPLHPRTLKLTDEVLSPWLLDDADVVMNRFIEVVAPRIELQRMRSSVSGAISGLLDRFNKTSTTVEVMLSQRIGTPEDAGRLVDELTEEANYLEASFELANTLIPENRGLARELEAAVETMQRLRVQLEPVQKEMDGLVQNLGEIRAARQAINEIDTKVREALKLSSKTLTKTVMDPFVEEFTTQFLGRETRLVASRGVRAERHAEHHVRTRAELSETQDAIAILKEEKRRIRQDQVVDVARAGGNVDVPWLGHRLKRF